MTNPARHMMLSGFQGRFCVFGDLYMAVCGCYLHEASWEHLLDISMYMGSLCLVGMCCISEPAPTLWAPTGQHSSFQSQNA